VVLFPHGLCGATYRHGPGVYAFTGLKPHLIVATTPMQRVVFWP
jgi:hypothetical protein